MASIAAFRSSGRVDQACTISRKSSGNPVVVTVLVTVVSDSLGNRPDFARFNSYSVVMPAAPIHNLTAENPFPKLLKNWRSTMVQVQSDRRSTAHDDAVKPSGITIERKNDGSISIHISANILKPRENEVREAAVKMPPSPKQLPQAPPLLVPQPEAELAQGGRSVVTKNYLSLRDVSEVLQLSPRTIWRLIAGGDFPHYRIGRVVRFKTDEVEEWVRSRKRERPGANWARSR